MDLGKRPTFGANSSPQTQPNTRVEAGAVWKRQSKSDNSEFLSIKIKFTKERLKALLEKEGDSVDIGYVGFSNSHKTADDKRPDFRLYEDKEN